MPVTITIQSSTDTKVLILTQEQELLMLDMVLSISDWVTKGPLLEKCANHRTRIIALMRKRYEEQGKNPPSPDDLIREYFTAPNYKNRKQRDEEEAIEALKRP